MQLPERRGRVLHLAVQEEIEGALAFLQDVPIVAVEDQRDAEGDVPAQTAHVLVLGGDDGVPVQPLAAILGLSI